MLGVMSYMLRSWAMCRGHGFCVEVIDYVLGIMGCVSCHGFCVRGHGLCVGVHGFVLGVIGFVLGSWAVCWR